MRDPLEGRLRWLFGSAATLFATLGVLSLVASVAGLGAVLPLGAAARLLGPMGVSYAVIASFLAATIALAPRRYTALMPLLAVSLLASAVTMLLSYAFGSAGEANVDRLVLAGGSIDLASSALIFGVWLRLWLAETPGDVRLERDERVLAGLLEALVPAGGPVDFGANEPELSERIRARMAGQRSHAQVRLRLQLRFLDVLSKALAGTWFADASPEEQRALLERLEVSPLPPLRRLFESWRSAALATFYEDARVQEAIGFDRGYVERKLEQGPNRDAHRARRERLAAEEVAEAVEKSNQSDVLGDGEAPSALSLDLDRARPAPG